ERQVQLLVIGGGVGGVKRSHDVAANRHHTAGTDDERVVTGQRGEGGRRHGQRGLHCGRSACRNSNCGRRHRDGGAARGAVESHAQVVRGRRRAVVGERERLVCVVVTGPRHVSEGDRVEVLRGGGQHRRVDRVLS